MKQMTFVTSLLAFILLSCSKNGSADNNNTDDLYRNAPRSELPAEIAPAEWRYGSVSALSYYDDRANFIAHSQEALREYKVTKDGFVEFVQYLSVPTGSCYNMTYTFLKGTMKWEAPNKITWTPVEGEFYKKFSCSGTNDLRKATKDDLDRSRSEYWYKLEDLTFSGKKDYIVMYNHPSMQSQYQEFAYKIIR
ncbi:MAG TPA: hypothetical protein VF609_05315 [Flavisolibacter sp.]